MKNKHLNLTLNLTTLSVSITVVSIILIQSVIFYLIGDNMKKKLVKKKQFVLVII